MADKIVKKVKKVAKKVAAKGAEIKADIQNVKNPSNAQKVNSGKLELLVRSFPTTKRSFTPTFCNRPLKSTSNGRRAQEALQTPRC